MLAREIISKFLIVRSDSFGTETNDNTELRQGFSDVSIDHHYLLSAVDPAHHWVRLPVISVRAPLPHRFEQGMMRGNHHRTN